MDKRNYGIDVARLACAFMVVLLHNLNQGGALDWSLSSPRSLAYVTLENYARVAVNIFALISGYLSSGRPMKPGRALDLWSSAFFWSGSMALVGLAGGAEPGVWTARAFFPLLGNVYWYLSAYFVLQLLVAFLGPGISHLGNRKVLLLSGLLIATCSVIGFTNEQGIGSGYSAFWLMLLWLAGRSMRLNRELIARWVTTPRLLAVVAVLPLCVTWLEWHDVVTGYDPTRWLSYIAPMVAIQSLCLFELLTRIRIRSPRLRKVLALLSGSAFGVYLIDTGGWFYGIWLCSRFAWVNGLPTRVGVPFILGISLAMFIAFLLLETLRRQAFKKMGPAVGRTIRKHAVHASRKV